MEHFGVVQKLPVALVLQKLHVQVPDRTLLGLLLGPIVGLLIWWLPLGVAPAAHKALAIAGFMLAYWIMEPVDHGITALIGCYLFWALKVTTFSTAFSGFTSPIPWFLFGTLVLGDVASRTGLAKRVGYLVITKVGLPSYAQLVLGIITLIFLLNFLIPSPQAQIAIVAPLLIGLITVFESGSRTTVAKGLFVLLTYTCTLFGKMILSSNNSILARGIIEAQTGQQVFWSQWLLAFLPVTVLTIVAGWLTILWLYPVEKIQLSRGQQFLREELEKLGPWSRDEQRALACLLLAVSLWATDLVHHLHPGMIALGIGLFLMLPKVGLLDMKAVRTLNFLLVIFMAGALSMGNVLNETAALTFLMNTVVSWIAPLLTDPWQATTILYWGGFLYHFLMADNAMVVTGLPVLLQLADVEGYHPIAMGLIWTFTTGGKVFVYQAASYIVGYSYGYFEGKDLLKVGAVLTVVEGTLLVVLVPLYWPLIGLPWRITPPSPSQAFTVSGADSQAPPAPVISWTPSQVTENIGQGTQKTKTVSFTSDESLNNVSVWIVPELQPYLRATPTSFSSISRGTPINITLTFSAPNNAPLQTFEGTVHLRDGGESSQTYAKPLQVTVQVWQSVVEKGLVLAYPALWQRNPRLTEPQHPISLNTFASAYGKGGVIPKSGAEISITTSSLQTRSLSDEMARDSLGAAIQSTSSILIGNAQATRVTYRIPFAPLFTCSNVIVYVPRGIVLYKFSLLYYEGEPREAEFLSSSQEILNTIQFTP